MTQAISLFDMLKKNGHEVSHVIVGKSKRRTIPAFFTRRIDCPVTPIESPNFVADKNNRSVNLLKTIVYGLLRIHVYFNSVKAIGRIVKKEHPDTVVNFYDLPAGLYFLRKRPVTYICVAHQFLLDHVAFPFPKGRMFEKAAIRLHNKIIAGRAEKILCLSFRELPDEPSKRLSVVPPLLREEISAKEPSDGEYFLVYPVNDGYSKQVEAFHEKNPEISIHCFLDKKEMPEVLKKDATLSFHRLNDQKFIEKMAGCKGYMTTAGFESVCEAMYMGKPVLMTPVEGHYEQACNAEDAKVAGAGISSDVFDLGLLPDYLPHYQPVDPVFKKWCHKAEEMFIRQLT